MTIMSNFLKQTGISFDVAEDGDEAVSMFKKKKYHVVLMGKFAARVSNLAQVI